MRLVVPAVYISQINTCMVIMSQVMWDIMQNQISTQGTSLIERRVSGHVKSRWSLIPPQAKAQNPSFRGFGSMSTSVGKSSFMCDRNVI